VLWVFEGEWTCSPVLWRNGFCCRWYNQGSKCGRTR